MQLPLLRTVSVRLSLSVILLLAFHKAGNCIAGPASFNAGTHWCRNSEIYNHDQIKHDGRLKGVRIVKDSKSDSAIIGHLYEQLGDADELWNSLDGIFACVVINEETGEFCAGTELSHMSQTALQLHRRTIALAAA